MRRRSSPRAGERRREAVHGAFEGYLLSGATAGGSDGVHLAGADGGEGGIRRALSELDRASEPMSWSPAFGATFPCSPCYGQAPGGKRNRSSQRLTSQTAPASATGGTCTPRAALAADRASARGSASALGWASASCAVRRCAGVLDPAGLSRCPRSRRPRERDCDRPGGACLLSRRVLVRRS